MLAGPIGAAIRAPSRSDPREFIGLALQERWHAGRTDSITQVSGGVSAWAGIVKGYTVTQSVSASRPAYEATVLDGRAGVRFDGTDDYLELAPGPFPTGGGNFEVWCVARQDALPDDTGTRILIGQGSGTSVSWRALRAVNAGVNRATLTVPDGTTATSVRNDLVDYSGVHLTRNIITNGASSVSVDGGPATSNSATVAGITNTRFRIGAYIVSTPTGFWQGVVAEILWTDLLTDAQSAQLTQYLKTQWGIA